MLALTFDFELSHNYIVYVDEQTGKVDAQSEWGMNIQTTSSGLDTASKKYYLNVDYSLYVIDVSGPAPLPVSVLPISDFPVDMDFDTSAGKLYGIFMTDSCSIGR